MSKPHSNCCQSKDINDLCDACRVDYEAYLDDIYMTQHEEIMQAMDDLLNKIETEGIFYGNQSKVG